MKKHVLLFLFYITVFWGLALPAFANHILGSELRYQFVSANGNAQTYKLTFVFFADCGETSQGSYNTLVPPADARVQIKIYKDGVLQPLGAAPQGGIYLDPVATGYQTEITPVCPDEANNTKCSVPKGDYPGVMKFTFEGLVTLPDTSSNWRFNFEGQHTSNSAGRSGLINNLVSPGTMCIYATLNNTLPVISVYPPYDTTGKNNSAAFMSNPTPFFCVHQPTTFNLAAVDADGDSLVFRLIPALNTPVSASGDYANCSYVTPLSATLPVAATPGSFVFSTTTGQTSFTPNAMINSCVVQQVSEYRNGTLVGTSMREMTFIILSNCPNSSPEGLLTNISNGRVDTADPTHIHVCQGIGGNVTFDLQGNDPDGDNMDIFATSLPSGATASVSNNGSSKPVLHFSWNTGGFAPGDYIFYVTLRDDGCPVRVARTIAYTISVHETYTSGSTDTVVICNGETYPFYGKLYYRTGTYTTTFATVHGCDSVRVLNLRVNPLPNMTLNGSSTTGICPGKETVLSLALPEPTTTYQWLKDGTPVPAETAPAYTVTETGYYRIAALTDKGCADTSRKIRVDKYPVPEAHIVAPDNNPVCLGDTVSFKAAEGNRYSYRWSPEAFFRLIVGNEGPEVRGKIDYSGPVVLTVFNKYGCFDTDSILVQTKPCCDVFVPSAFSPNKDGLNDYFSPGLQPGQVTVLLQVFNRWGRLVYNHKGNSKGWDGTYENGEPATSDTYKYQLLYSCSDGHNYEKKGDLTLIR